MEAAKLVDDLRGARSPPCIGIRRKAKKRDWKITVLNGGFISSFLTCLADSIVLERVFLL
jgi:hypothetical protein